MGKAVKAESKAMDLDCLQRDYKRRRERERRRRARLSGPVTVRHVDPRTLRPSATGE
jgi:hypothetical protein